MEWSRREILDLDETRGWSRVSYKHGRSSNKSESRTGRENNEEAGKLSDLTQYLSLSAIHARRSYMEGQTRLGPRVDLSVSCFNS